jgi:pyrroloquinoline-quinone synthase
MAGSFSVASEQRANVDLDIALTPTQLELAIRAVGAGRYHDKHPFHKLLHGGKLNKGQVQAWALNRFCYQDAVPRKDAAFMSRVHDLELRREWIHRIHDHDGIESDAVGGVERWLVLTDGLGLPRDYVVARRGALPATKFAVEAYVRFVVEQPLVVAIASSLTELFAPAIHRERIAGMLANYDFVDESVMAYFKRRLTQAPRDADFALSYVLSNAKTRPEQEPALRLYASNATSSGRSSMLSITPMSNPGLCRPALFARLRTEDLSLLDMRLLLMSVFMQLEPHRVENREGTCKSHSQDPGKVPHRLG